MKAQALFILQCIVLSILTTASPGATAPGDAVAGRTLYTRLCVSCHGPTGQRGSMAAMLAVPPRDLTDHSYMSTRSDQQLFDVISKGGGAVGLSTAMTAFGNQLTEQQTWDVVAYVRTLATVRSTAAASETPRSAATAPGAELTMARLRLSIWPEYDDPRVLIILRGEMAPRQAFPTSLTLPLPKGAEIIGAGMLSEQNELLLHPYQILPGEAQDSLQLNLPVPRFFLEFYYNPFTASGAEKRFTYTAPATYPIELLEVDVQQPLRATHFSVEPLPMERLTDTQGFTYHQSAYRDVKRGQSPTFTISYTKTVTTPSVARQQPATPAPGQRPIPSRQTLIMLGVLAGTIVLFSGWAWLLRGSRRQPMPEPASIPHSTPTPDALLALLREDTPAPDITRATPLQSPARVVNFCTHCGRQVLPDDRFCSACGKPIKR